MLRVQSISFSYEDKQVLSQIRFSVLKGQSIALIGESGSGKSTLLKLIYGLMDADSGSIFWKDKQILGPAYNLVPGMDFMKYLAQDFDLMPFVSVAENVGRFLSNFYLEEKKQRVDELLELVDMTEFANVKAQFLSGGQMQRTALARVLALEPELLLLDEPFSHIDHHQKSKLSQHVFQYCKSKGITIVYTSHTPEEILMFSDEVIVMKDGAILTKERPQHIYELPSSEYIARLTGEINLIPVRYLGVQNDEILLVRPHQFFIANEGYQAKVISCYYSGRGYVLKAQFHDVVLTIESREPLSGTIHFLIR
ncbi:ABC transporter ATP-binding protein [Flavobacterium sp. CBA20B-1]|uniref:ABC transporter ATP-binding protein n=1 Tax=unclassified Flavobacterium TaxID=196869 RepID=UPI002224B294|nr:MULTISPECIES: ABC transporter ATP-binding protein [unclassified Flavobacterium]WCM41958.1 ABC transporter ATP-binding protein [Flavobacterium sp. CBA20B-1]